MSGHSKWHTIKHKKGALDAKRGKITTRMVKEITVAARMGGGDPGSNARLRKAVSDAKAENVPNDTIDKAIKRGTGEIEGLTYEEITYEGYGPAGVAIMVQATTDNRNRTVSELRHLFSKNGGNLGESGCVGWMFDYLGIIVLDKDAGSEEQLFELVAGAGADDLKDEDTVWEVLTSPETFNDVYEAIKNAGLSPISAEITMVPKTSVKLEGKDAQAMLKFYDALDDHDDVQKISANFEVDESEY
ncbi:MAG TPA: YebC/PmpR family DNA-binding transcriptional regulator [Acidobacteriota bacterium]|nr:YebC/PmpR family DNA-binding transcriptional regulator [Acidobacteriota bacterium]HMZ78813.1 YebC/PmpR family DNA-binding transcriptional regulator [Acidobacteriota bacterium]HNB72306.1 YebC/PmpR family DNA-binding transcriptional regulator [Acidobacteriota bacterium]HNC45782.1 YebC/PmpR family DNA-binding transcriptional regulator [Acidobacteriota bacterium]HND17771.1 YebC/PmpR family DNA-binding transcriptional regulator [Acidobacteriota bacterium]